MIVCEECYSDVYIVQKEVAEKFKHTPQYWCWCCNDCRFVNEVKYTK